MSSCQRIFGDKVPCLIQPHSLGLEDFGQVGCALAACFPARMDGWTKVRGWLKPGWLDDVEVGAPPLVGPTQVSSSEPARPQTYASVTPKPRRRW